MEVEISHIWASPSTLHLRLVVWGKDRSWMRLNSVHVPMEQIPSEVRRLIMLSDGFEGEPTEDPIPGL